MVETVYSGKTMSRNSVIHVRNIHKSYGKLKAVQGLTFDVPRSSCYGFLGPNGAGKTTTMNMIYGRTRRDKHTDSCMEIFGYDPAIQELEIKSLCGVVPQEDNLDVELDVRKNLMIYSKLYGLAKREAEDRIDEQLDFMELKDKRNARIRELSGGMKRRLLIARALLNRPRLLILDEPTTGLDPQVRHLIWNKLRQLKTAGTTILLTTHYMEEAFQLADQILIINQGKKLLEGNPQQLLEQHMERYVLEVRNPLVTSMFQEIIRFTNVRLERFHDSMLLYANDIDSLREAASELDPKDYYQRQTNLEDLFLKLTGRELYEHQ
jgi:lipooligosaccharide transport system ATP-binding protein